GPGTAYMLFRGAHDTSGCDLHPAASSGLASTPLLAAPQGRWPGFPSLPAGAARTPRPSHAPRRPPARPATLVARRPRDLPPPSVPSAPSEHRRPVAIGRPPSREPGTPP